MSAGRVVGVDGSDASMRALPWAADSAAATWAHIEALTLWEMPATYGCRARVHDVRPTDTVRKVLESVGAEAVDSEPHAELTLAPGDPAHSLVEASKRAPPLVVRSHGMGGVEGILLGCVDHDFVQHADCPVFVFRGQRCG